MGNTYHINNGIMEMCVLFAILFFVWYCILGSISRFGFEGENLGSVGLIYQLAASSLGFPVNDRLHWCIPLYD